MPKAKSKLSLGKRCYKVKSRQRSQTIKFQRAWIRTEDEVFNRVTFSPRFTRPYMPVSRKKLKTFKDLSVRSPLKSMATPQKKSGVKRILSKSHSEKEITPSKSPFPKKTRRTLYAPIASSYAENINLNDYDNRSSENDLTLEQLETELDCTSDNPLVDEIVKLVPTVVETLHTEGFDKEFLDFFKLVSQNKFPMKNIAFQLWLEVVKWFSKSNTTEMRYSETTKKFWKLGYRLFGGQFIHFMSGSKNSNTVVMNETKRGLYSPENSEINFAVPGKDILTSYSPYEISTESKSRKPGLFTDMIETLASTSKFETSYCVTFDGKKLKRGLTKTSGDVDLLGHEDGLSLSDRRGELAEKKRPVNDLLQRSSKMNDNEDICAEITEDEQKEISDFLTNQYKTISLNICEARSLKKKKEYQKEKLIEKSGKEDWKNSKYVYGISSTIAYIHDIETYIIDSNDIIEELLTCISCLRKSKNVISKTEIDLNKSEYYCEINPNEESQIQTTRQIKQRSQQWFDQRKQVKVTGSSIHNALGLDGLASQKDHFDVKVVGLPEKERSEKCKSAMLHGTENEINAAATMVGKVLPMLFPGQKMYEEGFIEMQSMLSKPFMIISPDGSIRSSEKQESTTCGIEFKCPIYDVQTSFPQRYLLQCLSEIEALDVQELLYLSWFPEISTCFRIHRHTSLFQTAIKLAEELYDTEKPRRPTKLSEESRQLSLEIQKACKSEDTVEFVGVFTSLKHRSGTDNTYHNGEFSIQRFELLLNQLMTNYDRFYELQRVPATEAVVFLCCDLDRKWETDRPHSVPVCWLPKGSSLNTDTMRNIVESVLDNCKLKGLYVPALSFDRQWHLIAVRDKNSKPLTALQLQKDLWAQVEKMSKREIVHEIAGLNKTFTVEYSDDIHITCGNIQVTCTNGGIPLPRLSGSVAKQRRKENLSQKQTTHESESVFNNEETSEFDDTGESNDTQNEQTTNQQCIGDETIEWTERDSTSLLALFKVDKIVSKSKSWVAVTSNDISAQFIDHQSIRKFRDCELRVIARYINRTHKLKLRESDRKESKIEQICKLLGVQYSILEKPRTTKTRTLKQPSRLSELAVKQVNKCLLKRDLNIVYAEYLWNEEYRKWKQEHSEPEGQLPADSNEDEFYYPSYSTSRRQFEVSCVDSSHLLTRTRRKSARGGLDGLSNEAWRKVAKSKKTSLSIGMIDCILEPMSVAVANTHFSEDVENEMLNNGDVDEAKLCRDIRDWWRAEDEPGISVENRFRLRSALRSRLLGHVDLSKFPPPGMFIKGWPLQLWEAIIASIDAKRILYNLVKRKTYHVRAFSSMMGETFFSEVTLYDRRGQGTLTCDEFGKFIDTTIEKLHMRLDPNRSFSYLTSRKKVYQLVGQYSIENSAENSVDGDRTDKAITTMKNHEFDDPGRCRVKSKNKEAKQEGSRNAIARGTLPVRFESARRNESKLLPTYRLGLDMDDIK